MTCAGRQSRIWRSRRGFTIVEVMLAVGILAVLTSVMWMSIANMFQTRDVVEERSARYQMVRVSMDRMVSELASAYLAGPQFGGEELPGEESMGMAEGEEGEAAAMAPMLQEPLQFGLIGRDDEVNFTTLAYLRTLPGEKASNHAEIGYFIRTARNEEGRMVKKLMRRVDTTLDDDITRGGVIYEMLPEIESVELAYWDPGQVELGTMEEIGLGRWIDAWDTTRRDHAGRLPSRIKITLTLPPPREGDEPEVFTTQTQLGVTEVLEF